MARLQGDNILGNLPLAHFPLTPGLIEPGALLAFSADEKLFPVNAAAVTEAIPKEGPMCPKTRVSPAFSRPTPRRAPHTFKIYDPWLDPYFSLDKGKETILRQEMRRFAA